MILRRTQKRPASSITVHRAEVAAEWERAVGNFASLDDRIPARLPGYFADRFAFVAAERLTGPIVPGFDLPAALESRDQVIERFRRPAVSIGGWVPELGSPTGLGDAYAEFLSLWREFITRHNVFPKPFCPLDRSKGTWREVFDDSVFYPRPPAIAGAEFFDRLGDGNRKAIIARWGASAPIDFFCLMHQFHETIHRNQVGEPLLCEVVQAAIWARFVLECGLSDFQHDPATGLSCIRESDLIARHSWLFEHSISGGLDTAQMIDAVAPSGTYWLLCRWANLFDQGCFNYNQYLNGVSDILDKALHGTPVAGLGWGGVRRNRHQQHSGKL